MLLREYAGHRVDLNDEGFLVDSTQWTPEIAEEIARRHRVAFAEKLQRHRAFANAADAVQQKFGQ